MIENITKILPMHITGLINSRQDKDKITEIRLRVGKRLKIYFGKEESNLELVITKQDLLKILGNISANSIYSIQNDLNKGFVTIEGGNRIGIAGEVVLIDGKIKNIKEISSMNIRVSHEIIGSSNHIMDKIVEGKTIKNTIIVSPPGFGKTTLLRDIIRNLSGLKYNVAVIDERGEIAAMYDGYSSLDIGERVDVISFVDKVCGMQMAIRSLAPDIVCTDEIGSMQDVEAVKYLCKCGVGYVTTLHGNSLKDVMCGPMKELLDNGYIDNVIVLGGKCGLGKIDKVYTNLSVKEKMIC